MAVFTASIAASTDDAFQDGTGAMDTTGLVFNVNGVNYYAGFRFLNVTIPNAAVINSATMAVNLTSASYDSPDVIIYCEDVDDATTFTTTSGNISGRTPTTATTAWAATNIGIGIKTTPNFANAVQEVVLRGGWASGNDLNVILKGDDAATVLRGSTWDSTNPEAVITIDYTVAGAGAATKMMHYAKARKTT